MEKFDLQLFASEVERLIQMLENPTSASAAQSLVVIELQMKLVRSYLAAIKCNASPISQDITAMTRELEQWKHQTKCLAQAIAESRPCENRRWIKRRYEQLSGGGCEEG